MNQQLDREHRAVLYIRIGGLAADEAKVNHQRAGCLRIATQHGLSIAREYVDNASSAQLDDLPELRQLLADLDVERDAAFVVIWDYSRIGSDFDQLDLVTQRVRACDAQIITMTGVEAAARYIQEQHTSNTNHQQERRQS
jgi:site-specific DNA recombinase